MTYDFLAPGLFRNPHPFLHKLRAEQPVHYSSQLDSWMLTMYEDVDAAFYDPRLHVVEETKRIDVLPPAEQGKLLPLRRSFEMWMGRSQEVDHDRFQKLLRRHFTPQVAEGLRVGIERLNRELFDRALHRDKIDMVNDIAHPLAMRVVTELVLDLPSTQIDMLLARSQDISGLLEMGEQEQLIRCQNAVLELSEYLAVLVRRHRSEGRGGVVGVLLQAKDEGIIRGDEEIVANIIMFLVVGYHTTANLLSSGLQLLFDHPAERARLAANLDLLPTAIDEMMRYHGPVATVRRRVLEDFELRGKHIRAGQTLVLVITAANRDPAVYTEPDRFDITRQDNRHLGFTVGPYSCMGKAVARIEAETYFSTILQRMPRIRPFDPTPDWMIFRPLGCELRTLRVLPA